MPVLWQIFNTPTHHVLFSQRWRWCTKQSNAPKILLLYLCSSDLYNLQTERVLVLLNVLNSHQFPEHRTAWPHASSELRKQVVWWQFIDTLELSWEYYWFDLFGLGGDCSNTSIFIRWFVHKELCALLKYWILRLIWASSLIQKEIKHSTINWLSMFQKSALPVCFQGCIPLKSYFFCFC